MGLGLLRRTAGIKRIFKAAGVSGAAGLFFLTGVLLPAERISAEERLKEDSQEEYPQEVYPQEVYPREVYPREVYPLIYGEWPGQEEDVIVLTGDMQEYQVLPGDSLWKISEKLWGEGKWYGRLTLKSELSGVETSGEKNNGIAGGEEGRADGQTHGRAGSGILEDPNLIYPGMVLQGMQKGYICRRHTSNVGMQMGNYSMDTPGNWTVGTISSGDALGNLVFSGDGFNKIVCLVQDKREETEAATEDWEVCAEKIRNYVGKYYKENVSDLTFEHYRTGQGEEVYLYSFVWKMEIPGDPEAGKAKVNACMGLKLTEHIQAEFLGFASRYDIHGGVRYTTASFEEHVKDYDPETFTVNDSNMSILPEAEWELKGLYDPFSWLDEFFGTMLERAAGTKTESGSGRERLMERIERPGGRR